MRSPLLWLVLAISLAAYIALIQAGFVWDDMGLLLTNDALIHPSWAHIWQSDLWCCVKGKEDPTPYYRPLVTLSFLLDYTLGPQAGLAHLQSLFWHLLAQALLFVLLDKKIGSLRAAAAALIFGLHPIQSEAVAWIAARNDPMATAGLLATLLLLEKRRLWAWLPLAAAMLSKESTVLFPALLLGWHIAWPAEHLSKKQQFRHYLQDLFVVFPGLLLPLVLRWQATLGPAPEGRTPMADLWAAAFTSVATVLGWLSWPWPLTTGMTIYRSDPSATVLLSALLSLSVIGFLLQRGGWRALALLGSALLAYAPALASVIWYGTLGERYLYLPMVFLATLIASWMPSGPTFRQVSLSGIALGLGCVLSLWALHVRLPDWRSTETLWRAAAERLPDAYTYQMLATELHRTGKEDEALALFDTSLEMPHPRRFACGAITDLAATRWPLERFLARVEVWDKADCRTNLGYDAPIAMALATSGRWAEAEARLRSARRLDPKHRDRLLKGAIALVNGDLAMAGSEALLWSEGAGDYAAQILTLANNRRALESP